jgi:hypothetical protein
MTKFTNRENITLLWDILLDELSISKTNKTISSNIKTIFDSNLNIFISKINPNINTNIMTLNKQFLSQVVQAVNQLIPNLKQIKRINISDEPIDEIYKIEDIQLARQSEFDKELEKQRLNLETYMTPQKPKDVNFTLTNTDVKIKEMDYLLSEKLAQRNIELEQLQEHTPQNINPEQWLIPKETSIKTEKKQFVSLTTTEKQTNKKNVTWNEETSQNSSNIFNKLKLKTITNDELTINELTNLSVDELTTNAVEDLIQTTQTQYVEQKSVPLVSFNSLVNTNIHPNIDTFKPIELTTNEPILPKTEIIKQLNEMNSKIDQLYDMVLKLTDMLVYQQTEK